MKQSYICHCRLGQINEKRIFKLHKDGYLDTFDYESFETCGSYSLRKITETTFVEKMNELVTFLDSCILMFVSND